jgi:hypothetical protein
VKKEHYGSSEAGCNVAADFHALTDFAAIDAVVDATHRYHEIFYEKQD